MDISHHADDKKDSNRERTCPPWCPWHKQSCALGGSRKQTTPFALGCSWERTTPCALLIEAPHCQPIYSQRVRARNHSQGTFAHYHFQKKKRWHIWPFKSTQKQKKCLTIPMSAKVIGIVVVFQNSLFISQSKFKVSWKTLSIRCNSKILLQSVKKQKITRFHIPAHYIKQQQSEPN